MGRRGQLMSLRTRLAALWNWKSWSQKQQAESLSTSRLQQQQLRQYLARTQARLPDKYGNHVAGHALANHALQTYDNVQHTKLNEAMDLMAARATFGPEIDKLLQDAGETTVTGGGVKNEVHLDRTIPKSNPWPWLALITGMILAWVVWYQMSHPPTATAPTLTPGASKIGISVTPGS